MVIEMQVTELLRILTLFQKAPPDDVGDLSLSMMIVFLLVCQEEGRPTGELADILKVSDGTVTNIVRTLAEGRKRDGVRRPGYHLLRQEQNPDDYRVKNVYLTPKGKELLKQLQQGFYR